MSSKLKKNIKVEESSSESDASSDSSSSGESICNAKIVVKKPVVWSKDRKYGAERLEILKKINKLLSVDKNVRLNLESVKEESKKKIVALKDEIATYFYGKHTACFSGKGAKREYLSLAKLVYKEMGYVLERIVRKEGDDVYSYYIIIKDKQEFIY